MLVVSLNKESYEYDVHSLVKAFYPEEQVSVLLPESSEKKQSELQGQIRIRIEIQDEGARVSVDGQEYCWKTCEDEMLKRETEQSAAASFSAKQVKDGFKRFLYRVLYGETGKT